MKKVKAIEKSPVSERKPSIRIKTILVPMDFSPSSMEALNLAVSLAKKFHAGIHLVHVHPPDEASATPGAGHRMRECAEATAFLRDELSKVQRKHVPSFWPENCHVRGGRPYEEISHLARDIAADLIVLATRGHTGLKHVLLGSTAERVVRFAACPVLVARPRKRKSDQAARGAKATTAELSIRTILVPVDFSKCSLAGLIYAASFARQFDARLRLLHVLFPRNQAVVMDRVGRSLSGAWAEADRKNAELEMEALTKLDFLRDMKCETEIRAGHPIDQICGASSKPDIDLLVTSTHGHTGFKHALIGSVAEHIVRYAECPVLIVPNRLMGN